jgi:hypothetical protein
MFMAIKSYLREMPSYSKSFKPMNMINEYIIMALSMAGSVFEGGV